MLIVDIVIWSLLAAFVVSKFFRKTREPILLDLGFLAAAVLIASGVYYAFDVPGLTLFTILASVTGVVLLMAGFRAVPDHLAAKSPAWRRFVSRTPDSFSQGWARWRAARPQEQESIAAWEGEGGAPLPPPPAPIVRPK